ncbi:MAG TPA: NUDIX domain-containing protein [Deltaproteobacteria bacterium]|nr:NUDIX domain-containing protein [Deltaproteobacteria bacterium]
MDLGSGICTPRNPDCPACPVAAVCKARKQGAQESIPARKKPQALPHREAVAALIANDRGEVLLTKRPDRGLLGGLWRFPGGILNAGEAPAAGLRRVLREELGLKALPGKEVFSVEHGYSHFFVTVHVLTCSTRGPIPDAGAGVQWSWAGPRGLSRLAVSRLERKILGALQSAGDPNEDGKTTLNRVK